LWDGQQNSETYRALHPLGVVPVLKTMDYTIFESVAIVLQLLDEHPEKHLAPALATPARAYYYQWSVFACAELDPSIMLYFDNTMRPPEQKGAHDPKLAERAREDFALRAIALSQVTKRQEYLLGAEFSGADIIVGHSCFMARLTGLLADYPILETYYDRLQRRPAHQRAYPDFSAFANSFDTVEAPDG